MGLIAHYIRIFIRSNFRPLHRGTAKKWQSTTSILYFLIAWSTLGYAIYVYRMNKDKNADSPYVDGKAFTPYQSMRKFGISDEATLIKIRGTSIEKEVLSFEEIKEKSKV